MITDLIGCFIHWIYMMRKACHILEGVGIWKNLMNLSFLRSAAINLLSWAIMHLEKMVYMSGQPKAPLELHHSTFGKKIKGEEDFKRIEDIISALKKDGYTVIFTFQYQENERYSPTESQVRDFRRVIDIGADIVSGSQAHQPMGVEFWEDGFINYGLGNLFFNMRNILGLKQGIIARHIFYDGKHINTILITTILEDLSQPRLTTPEERVKLLESIFAGSIK